MYTVYIFNVYVYILINSNTIWFRYRRSFSSPGFNCSQSANALKSSDEFTTSKNNICKMSNNVIMLQKSFNLACFLTMNVAPARISIRTRCQVQEIIRQKSILISPTFSKMCPRQIANYKGCEKNTRQTLLINRLLNRLNVTAKSHITRFALKAF